MDLYWKTVGGILIALVLILAVGKQQQDLALLLGMMTCVLAVGIAFVYLEPVLDFLYRLEQLGDLQTGILQTLLKILGIGLTSQIAGLICQDSGNASLARGMELLGTSAVLLLSLPIFETLLELVLQILGDL